MRNIFRLFKPNQYLFSSKKLGIADTAKVIQDKILNISQVVIHISYSRTILKNLVQSSVLVMVLQELSDLIKFKQDRWCNSDQASEVWLSIYKLIM